MPYFVMVYDRRGRRVVELLEFPAERREDAMRLRDQREEAELANGHVEVVLFGAESESALRKTHARYFDHAADIASRKA